MVTCSNEAMGEGILIVVNHARFCLVPVCLLIVSISSVVVVRLLLIHKIDNKIEDLTNIKAFPVDKIKIIALYLEF